MKRKKKREGKQRNMEHLVRKYKRELEMEENKERERLGSGGKRGKNKGEERQGKG